MLSAPSGRVIAEHGPCPCTVAALDKAPRMAGESPQSIKLCDYTVPKGE